jgi:hypothetical protein
MRAKCDWGAPLLCLLALARAQTGVDFSYFRVRIFKSEKNKQKLDIVIKILNLGVLEI